MTLQNLRYFRSGTDE